MLSAIVALCLAAPDGEVVYDSGEEFEKVALSSDGSLLATNSPSGVAIYEQSGRLLRNIALGDGETYAVIFHPTRPELYVDRKGMSRIDLRTGQVLARNPEGTLRLGIGRDGRYLALLDNFGVVKFLDADTLLPVKFGTVPNDYELHASNGSRINLHGDQFSVNGSMQYSCPGVPKGEGSPAYVGVSLVYVHEEKKLTVVDCASQRRIATVASTKPRPFKLNLSTRAFSMDGSTAFLDNSFVDLATGAVLGSLEDPSPSAELVMFSADGRKLLSVHASRIYDGTPNADVLVRSWNLETLRPESTSVLGRTNGWMLASVPESTQLVMAGPFETVLENGHQEIKPNTRMIHALYDAETRTKLGELKEPVTAVSQGFGVSTVGNRLYGTATTDLRTRKLSKPSPSFRGASALLTGVGVSNDGLKTAMYVFMAGDSQGPALVILEKGRPVQTARMPGADLEVAVAFSADAKTVLALDGNGVLRRVDVDSGQVAEVARYTGYRGRFYRPLVRYAPDGRSYWVAFPDNSFRGFDAASNAVVSTLQTDGRFVRDFAFHSKDDLMAGAMSDHTIRLWRRSTGELLASLVMPSPEEFVAFLPSGDYVGSKLAISRLSLVRGLDRYPFESLELARHRPDRVARRLGYASEKLVSTLRTAVERRAKLSGFSLDDVEREPELPRAGLRKPIPRVSAVRQLALDIEATDAKALARVEVYVNGVPASTTTLTTQTSRTWSGIVPIVLSEGVNQIDVSSTNTVGFESLRERRTVVYTGPSEKKTLHVLAAGVSDYGQNEYDLKYAAKDAKDIIRVLGKGVPGFDQVKVHELLDAAVTRESLSKLEDTLREAKVDDMVVVFVAGHGMLDDELNYYFAPADMDFAQPALRGIDYGAIERLVSAIPPRRKLLLMDTCFSGEIEEPEATKVAPQVVVAPKSSRGVRKVGSSADILAMVQTLFSDLRRATGAQVISSAGGGEFAMESDEWKNGLFTHAVLEGLTTQKADVNRDESIRVRELYDYVTSRVLLLSGGQQRPTSRRENLSLDFAVR